MVCAVVKQLKRLEKCSCCVWMANISITVIIIANKKIILLIVIEFHPIKTTDDDVPVRQNSANICCKQSADVTSMAVFHCFQGDYMDASAKY